MQIIIINVVNSVRIMSAKAHVDKYNYVNKFIRNFLSCTHKWICVKVSVNKKEIFLYFKSILLHITSSLFRAAKIISNKIVFQAMIIMHKFFSN